MEARGISGAGFQQRAPSVAAQRDTGAAVALLLKGAKHCSISSQSGTRCSQPSQMMLGVSSFFWRSLKKPVATQAAAANLQ